MFLNSLTQNAPYYFLTSNVLLLKHKQFKDINCTSGKKNKYNHIQRYSSLKGIGIWKLNISKEKDYIVIVLCLCSLENTDFGRHYFKRVT